MGQVPGNMKVEMGYKGLSVEIPLEDLLEIALANPDGYDEGAILEGVLYTPQLREAMVKKVAGWSRTLTTEEYQTIVDQINGNLLALKLDALKGLLVDRERAVAKRDYDYSYDTHTYMRVSTLMQKLNEVEIPDDLDKASDREYHMAFREIWHLMQEFKREEDISRAHVFVNRPGSYGHAPGYAPTYYSGSEKSRSAGEDFHQFIRTWMEGGEIPSAPPMTMEQQVRERVAALHASFNEDARRNLPHRFVELVADAVFNPHFEAPEPKS